MADAAGEFVVQDGAQQFGGVWSRIWTVRGTINVGNLGDGTGESNDITIPGVALGDQVLGLSLGVSITNLTVTAWCKANTVTVRFQNESGGAIDLADTSFKIVVGRPSF